MQSSILKKLCTVLYLVRRGDYWYEERNTLTFVQSFPYKVCWWLIYSGFLCMFASEALSALLGDYTQNQRNDILSHVIPQIILLTKILIFFKNSSLIKKLNRDMTKVCREHERDFTLDMQNRRIRMFASLYAATVASVFTYIIMMAAVGMIKH
ncbi:hypothetical protein EVAR_82724_1, partial [Eumeta japonica]